MACGQESQKVVSLGMMNGPKCGQGEFPWHCFESIPCKRGIATTLGWDPRIRVV